MPLPPRERLPETPSQTAGPYVHIGTLPPAAGIEMQTGATLFRVIGSGEPVTLEGVVYDGAGEPVRDAMLELYQTDSEGAPKWGRTSADFDSGLWRFETVRPAALDWKNGAKQAPHFTLLVFARGINIHLHTRAYLPEDTAALQSDPGLRRIEQASRRESLIASKTADNVYRFDIRLQGDRETVFFDM